MYSQEQLDFLREGYKRMQQSDLTQAFNERFGTNKTKKQVKSTLANHGFRAGRGRGVRPGVYRIATPEQVEWIKTNYKKWPITDLTAAFNEAHGTNLKVSQLRAFVNNHGIQSGRSGQFEPGHKSWNKNTKGLTRANKTSFKKGDAPANERPLGAERICSKDGYILVKVKEPNPYTGTPTRFKHKHHVVWEAVHGPVKPGNVLMFLDGDKTNCNIENLAEISRAKRCWLNRTGHDNLPDELKPTHWALADLVLATHAAEKSRIETK